jgi:UDP-N-acetylglucosamine 1-carboxyvinyltransferase
LEKILVAGGVKLKGTVRISGAKNAVLPILAASLLAQGPCILRDVPRLADVDTTVSVLEKLGSKVMRERNTMHLELNDIVDHEAPYEFVRKMRASFLVMGPLLARIGKARISLPGGCAIGTRPIDLHLKGFAALGAEIINGHGYIEAVAPKLKGSKIYLDFPSVGATENIMMAAVMADGQTQIENAAEEPEIVDLANFLNVMGANVRGAGTNLIKIEGVSHLKGADHTVIPDRIEAGTFMVAAAATGGEVLIENILIEHLKPLVAKLKESGASITEEGDSVKIIGRDDIGPLDIKTLPYPGFPTDLQAQVMAMLTVGQGTSIITETVFENRFMHVDELKRMGAKIKIDGRTAIIDGVPELTAAPVKATDLRAGAALIIAGMLASGVTEITNIHHIDRGYENIEEKFRGLGAKITREST